MTSDREQDDRPARPARAVEKRGLFAALGLLLTLPYFTIQHHLVFAAAVVPLTPIDRIVPFFQPAIYLYVSFYLLLLLPLLLGRDEHDLRQMALGFGWIVCVSHVLFFVWPTTTPSLISSEQVSDPLLRLISAADRNLNACPSLHASLAIYCALCSAPLLGARGRRAALWLWVSLILASTLLTRRHVALDLFAGAALALVAYASLFLRQHRDATGSRALPATLAARAGLLLGHEDELAALTRQDWRKRSGELLCFALAGAFGVWLTVTGLAGSRWFMLAAGISASAIALNAFVLLMHDGMHGTLFSRPKLNWAGSVVLGATFLMSFSAYRVLHARHHKFLGDPRDPDDYHNYISQPALLWALHFVRLTFGSLLYLMAIPVLSIRYGTERERRRILIEYGILIAAYGTALRLVPAAILLVAWFIPLLLVGSLTAIRGFAQHGITDSTDPFIASRTILPRPAIRFLLLNENYHLEHHLFPEVPSYHLPGLHELVWPQLPRVVSGRGYLRFLAKFLRATPRLDQTPIGLESRAAKSP